jgi:hypothetical protein
MKQSKIILSIIILLVLFGCKKSSNPVHNLGSENGGVILTFDDFSVEDWLKADSIYSKAGWKATFCITKFPELSEARRQGIVTLKNNGNEIAFHGTHHVRAAWYIRDHSVQEYIDYEITPGLEMMRSYGLNPTSFAYPGGVRDAISDSVLFNFFSLLRATTFNSGIPENQNCYTTLEGSPLVYALGIDNHYKHMHLDYIYELLSYANSNNKIIIFYGHRILDDDTTAYVTSYHTLNFITDFVERNKMKYYTLSELTK